MSFKTRLKSILGPKLWHIVKLIAKKNVFDEVEMVYRLLHDTDVAKSMLDVGAHHGGSLARFAHDGWLVYAFEPDPVNRSILAKAYGLWANIDIDPRAISNKEETGKAFFTSELSSGISSLSSFHKTHRKTGVVNSTTLRGVMAEKGLQNVGFLKVDTEGHDLFVLQGFPWDSIRPAVVLCEFDDAKTIALGYGFHDLANYLKKKKYHLLVSEWYPLSEYGNNHKWRQFCRYDCDLADVHAWGNIIAVDDEVMFSSLSDLSVKYARRYQSK